MIENVRARNPEGLQRVLQDMRIPGGGARENFIGAEFVLRYVNLKPGMLDDILAFEVYIKGLIGKNKFSRFIDLVTQKGVHFEFKNWKNFKPGTFLEQLGKDFQIANGNIAVFKSRFKWVFSSRIGTMDELKTMLKQALRNNELLKTYKIPVQIGQDLSNNIDSFVELF